MPDKYQFETEDIYTNLPTIGAPTFDTDWGVKAKNRRFTKGTRTAMDADMFQLVQNLLMHPSLPFSGDIGAMGRHAWASLIESLKAYLNAENKTMWSAIQSTQRRLTAERYVTTIEEQVKETADLLSSWTAAREWTAVADDMVFALKQLDDFPSAAWRRRVANEWLGNFQIQQLMKVWEDDMAQGDDQSWDKVVMVWREFQRIVEGSR